MAQRIFTLILLLCSTSVFAGLFDAPGRSQFVPADQAFTFDFQQNQHDLNLTWQIKDGYYLYRKQIRITPEHAKIADVQLPQGVWHEDEFYGKSEIYRDRLTLPVTINQASAGATLTVTYQGCADAGFCYPPETKTVPLSEVVANNAASQPVSVSQQEQHTAQLPFSALWALLIGIGIAFTPCVLPMYPLISGIVLGGKQRLSTARALLLTFIYVQGMALTYTALGLVVAAAGLQFQAALQHPYVLIGLAIVFTLLAMSMFGLFTLQLPSSLQTRLTLMSNLPKSGPWMEQVKTAFGFVILALPVFLLERVIGDVWGLRLWSALGVAFFGWAFITSLQAKRGWMRVVQIILLAAALVSVRPLQDWAFGATHTAQTQTHLNFTQIKTVDELNQALVEAKGKPVMLDLYADWCVACKEFEKYTFSDPQVQKALADTVLLQANVTANDAQDVALLKHLNVLGLPTILFFDGQGQEHPQARVTGFMDAETFSAHLRDRQP
ncbi:MAG: protein-disulfide reductase DsbD [Escherichia coli]|nr:protein-disulfide reductase DsbD [Escherichia coli]